MEEIKYVGETLWIGQVGHVAIVACFVAAIGAAIAYFLSTRGDNEAQQQSWKKLGRSFYIVHGLALITTMALIFYAMYNQMYEYAYVYEHVSDDLPMKYILSAFWEGQEGSFMLWMIWHVVLGYILLYRKDEFEGPVMFVIAAVEICISSMLLGVFVDLGGEEMYKLGSNPTALIRETMAIPLFSNADYLSLIKGNGLNPLLQNYWMTIHPPTVFLGFATTTIPFAYAIAGLWTGKHNAWLRPGLKWGLFSAGILGVGIFMGALWAYEALSFGGYWSWDPVENTSFVPWVILVAGIHTNLIANNTGRAIKSTYAFYLAGFLLIVYSTLLTRSGILGDTSAHAFTEMGLEWQLTFFLAVFLLGAVGLYFYKRKTIPTIKKEESGYSKEFWMNIGALVLLISSILIDGSSSLPVYNTIRSYFDEGFIGNVISDPVDHYNRYQLWVAILVSVLSGIAVWLRYKEQRSGNRLNNVWTRIAVHIVVAAVATYLLTRYWAIPSWPLLTFTFAGIFGVTTNTDFLVKGFGKNKKILASAVSHIGFGLMLIGLIGSGVNKFNLNNPFVFKGVLAEGNEEEVVILNKERPLLVRGHLLTYESDTLIDRMRTYTIKFQRVDKELNILDSFYIHPNTVYSNDFSNVAAYNPDIAHYWDKDVWACIRGLPPTIQDSKAAKEFEDTLKYQTISPIVGEVVPINEETSLRLNGINFDPLHPEYAMHDSDFGLELDFELLQNDEVVHKGNSAIGIEGSLVYKYPDNDLESQIRIRPSENIFDQFIKPDDELAYKEYNIKLGETITLPTGSTVKFANFSKEVEHENYIREEGDIAVAPELEVRSSNYLHILKPAYIIRDSRPMSLKEFIPETGMHIRVSNINPRSEEFTLKIAEEPLDYNLPIPIEIATNIPRTDYILLQATVFPGINYFWFGATIMVLGLLIGWAFKRYAK